MLVYQRVLTAVPVQVYSGWMGSDVELALQYTDSTKKRGTRLRQTWIETKNESNQNKDGNLLATI